MSPHHCHLLHTNAHFVFGDVDMKDVYQVIHEWTSPYEWLLLAEPHTDPMGDQIFLAWKYFNP
jgi:hypothetical protein